jgi:hypothetical protein
MIRKIKSYIFVILLYSKLTWHFELGLYAHFRSSLQRMQFNLHSTFILQVQINYLARSILVIFLNLGVISVNYILEFLEKIYCIVTDF